MGKGKHSDYDEIDFEPIKKWFLIIGILLIIFLIIPKIYNVLKEKIENKTETVSNVEIEYDGSYDIAGKVIIDKIDLEQNILDTSDDEGLEEGLIKLYGNNFNEIANVCIAGHNKDGMFGKLEELEIGNEIKIEDKDKHIFTYKIIEIYSVEPTDLSPLRQNNEKTEITLITCENYSTKRLIVKAEKEG